MPLNDEIIPLKIKFGIKSLARNANNGRVNNLEVRNEFVSKPKAIFFSAKTSGCQFSFNEPWPLKQRQLEKPEPR